MLKTLALLFPSFFTEKPSKNSYHLGVKAAEQKNSQSQMTLKYQREYII
jgi:hypothetical protein